MILNSPFITGSITVTNNVVTSGSLTVLGTINGAVTGSVNSASYAAFAATSNSASYAATSSFASNLTVANTLTANTLVVNTISSSVVFSSGSNVFGNALSNTQVMTGSVNITGSLSVNGTTATLGTGSSGYIPKWSGSLTLSNSLIYENVSSIGIGTTSPNAYDPSGNNLVVYEAGNAGITIATGATNFGSILFARETGTAGAYRGYIEYGQSADYMAFGTVSAERMRITSGGSVGIGTTSPTSGLGWSRVLDLRGSGSSAYINRISGSTQECVFGTDGAGLYLDVTGSPTASNNFISFRTVNSNSSYSATERMRITSAGRVGIGTSSPTNGYTLDVVGSILSQVASGNTSIVVQTNNANGAINAIAGTGLEIATDGTNQNMVFRTGAAERMRINSAGSVSITNSDSRLLGGTTTGRLLISNSDTSAYLILAGSSNGGSVDLITNQFITFTTGASYLERMRITSGGEVCINTTSTINSDRLMVQMANNTNQTGLGIRALNNGGTASQPALSFYNGSGTLLSRLYADNGTGYFAINTTSSNTERMRITLGGQVLINTTSDAYGDGSVLISTSAGKAATFMSTDNAGGYTAIVLRRTASNGALTEHYNGSTYAGGISISGASSSYGTSSDYRLKEDLKPIKGLKKLSKINVYDFKWKESNERMDGVIAHELQEVLPYAVTGIKDGEQIQSVDYSKIVPVLIQAIKELKAELDTIKQQI